MSSKQNNKSGYLFTVEILLEELSNGLALEKLLQTLNRSDAVKDYKIVNGVELGKLIDLNKSAKSSDSRVENTMKSDFTKPIGVKPGTVVVAPSKSPHKLSDVKPKPTNSAGSKAWLDRFTKLKNDNSLVRLYVVQEKGSTFDLPCRILHISSEEETLTVYHVDEKKVFTYKFNEIDNITTG